MFWVLNKSGGLCFSETKDCSETVCRLFVQNLAAKGTGKFLNMDTKNVVLSVGVESPTLLKGLEQRRFVLREFPAVQDLNVKQLKGN